MDQQTIERTLRTLLAPRLSEMGLTDTAIAPGESLLRSGVLDSFSLMDLLARAESELGTELDLNELPVEEFTTLNGLAAAFAKALSA